MNAVSAPSGVLERTLARDRRIVLAALAGVVALAWAWLIHDAASMPMDGDMPARPGIATFIVTATMWTIMMVGMMLPSAAPVVLLYGRVRRGGRPDSNPAPEIASFTLGYLLAWTAFSLVVAALQVGLTRAGLLDGMMQLTQRLVAGGLLLAAGIYQFSSAKDACLSHCRSPVDWLTRHWQRGPAGALRMGIAHGLYCVGCCWLLMFLLFATGVMNLLWVAMIAIFVLVEKLLPRGPLAGRLAGAALLLAGGGMLWAALH